MDGTTKEGTYLFSVLVVVDEDDEVDLPLNGGIGVSLIRREDCVSKDGSLFIRFIIN